MRKASDSTQLSRLRREMKHIVQERQTWATRAGMADREAKRIKDERDGWIARFDKLLDVRGGPCRWTVDEDGSWDTGCGEKFQFAEGGPFDNGLEYCGYCGQTLQEAEALNGEPCHDLGVLLQEAGATVKIGLRAQGHMPTVEKMLSYGFDWYEIGKQIGWSGDAVREWYERESAAPAVSRETEGT